MGIAKMFLEKLVAQAAEEIERALELKRLEEERQARRAKTPLPEIQEFAAKNAPAKITRLSDLTRNSGSRRGSSKPLPMPPVSSVEFFRFWPHFYPAYALAEKNVTVTIKQILSLSDAYLMVVTPDEGFDYWIDRHCKEHGHILTAFPLWWHYEGGNELPVRAKFSRWSDGRGVTRTRLERIEE